MVTHLTQSKSQSLYNVEKGCSQSVSCPNPLGIISLFAYLARKMMLWKCCTQYASKFGKLSSGHRTRKGQCSFQPQRKAMPKNAQTTAQLYSSHMLAKWCLTFSKPGFSNTWTVNFQMFKLVLEKVEESEIQIANIHWIMEQGKQVPEKHLLLLYWLCQSLWLCGSQ